MTFVKHSFDSDTNSKNKDWYLGLDIGSNSVGFCATNTSYDILTKGDKLQAGSRLFDSANDASTRRMKRSMRRRLARRRVRLNLLQELFSSYVDDSFFLSLNESNLWLEDKKIKYKFSLFNDKNFSDKDFYNRYPTIFHLRNDLVHSDIKDIRLLYLACHHLIKYRGNFLFDNLSTEDTCESYIEVLNVINDLLSEISEDIDEKLLNISNFDKDLSAAKKTNRVTDFWDYLSKKLNPDKDSNLKKVCEILKGNKISLSIFGDETNQLFLDLDLSKDEQKKFQFKSLEYEDVLAKIIDANVINDIQISFLSYCKKFYDLISIDMILDGSSTIAEAKVKAFNEHAEDLLHLKSFVKKYCPENYDSYFRYSDPNSTNKNLDFPSYANFIGSSLIRNKKIKSHSKFCLGPYKKFKPTPQTASFDDFLKYTKELVEDNCTNKNDIDYIYLMNKIREGTLCKKQRNLDNIYLPYQLTLKELSLILKKQQHNFPSFLTDEKVKKIIQILNFRIPYYVGPLSDLHNDEKNSFSWIKRKNESHKHVSITPFNFDEEVDLFESGERFINRMISKCTYCKDQTVLPAQSLLYQKYLVLNDLNNLKINGSRIDQHVKELLYANLFQKEENVTKTKIRNFLLNEQVITKEDLLGKCENGNKENENLFEFNSSLSSLIKLKKALGKGLDYKLSSQEEKMCENIIVWHTVFSSEKDPVYQRIKKLYGNVLSSDQIDRLSHLNFSGWGRLSEYFLTGIKASYFKTPLLKENIIEALEFNTLNLIEILNSDKYEDMFIHQIADYNNHSQVPLKVTYDDVEDLYCSPIVKRSIWQTILVVKDLCKVNKKTFPKKVFVEVTRSEDLSKKGKKESSRRERIKFLFSSAKSMSKLYGEQISKLENELESLTDEQLRSDRIYLYFIQLGRCMYSSESLDFQKLISGRDYDIDHIYPQSLVIDDSLSNRVLVCRKYNEMKGDKYPLSMVGSIQNDMKNFWSLLHDKKLIDDKKFNRLISNKELSYDEISGFNNRQLVSTNQAVKSVCQLLNKMFGNSTEIVYSKAEHVSNFRRNYFITKCRDVNDLHHAHDAYLNIVVGNVWNTMFKALPGSNEKRKFENLWGRLVSNNNVFNIKDDKYNSTTSLMFSRKELFDRSNNIIWSKDYLDKVKSYTINCADYYCNKFIVSRLAEKKSGAFYHETIHMKGEGQKMINLKDNLDPSKYGGYRSETTSHLMFIEYTLFKNDKKVVCHSFCKVPIRFVSRYKGNELLSKVCEHSELHIDVQKNNVKIVADNLLINSILEINHVRYLINDGDLNLRVSSQWYPNAVQIRNIKNILYYNKKTIRENCNDKICEDTFIQLLIAKKYQAEEFDKICEDTFIQLLEQLKKPFYKNYTFAQKVSSLGINCFIEKFRTLSIFDKTDIIKNVLFNISNQNSQCKAGKVGGAKSRDNCNWNKAKLLTAGAVNLIVQSPSGLYEKHIPLLR